MIALVIISSQTHPSERISVCGPSSAIKGFGIGLIPVSRIKERKPFTQRLNDGMIHLKTYSTSHLLSAVLKTHSSASCSH